MFAPICGENGIQFEEHMFLMGWFNHQLKGDITQPWVFNGLVQPPTSFFVIVETFQQRSYLGDLLTML